MVLDTSDLPEENVALFRQVIDLAVECVHDHGGCGFDSPPGTIKRSDA